MRGMAAVVGIPVAAGLVVLPALGCQPSPPDATVETTEARTTVEWRFDEPQPEWQPLVTMNPNTRPVKVERTDDALRLTLDESNNNLYGDPRGGIVIDLPQWNGWAWGSILVRARSSEGIQGFFVAFNTVPGEPGTSRSPFPYEFYSPGAETVNDGTVQTYLLRVRAQARTDTWDRLGLWVSADAPATFDVLSVSVVPDEAVPAAYLAGTTSRLMESAITGRTYQISVALPQGYDDSDRAYPVLYALDANGQFGTMVETARLLSTPGPPREPRDNIPELILVGIGYPVGYRKDVGTPRELDMVPQGSSVVPNSLRFMREELIPLIEAEYRADPDDRALYGHSMGGYLAFRALIHGEETFQRFIIGSGFGPDAFELEAAFADAHDSLAARAFFARGLLESAEGAASWRKLFEVLDGRQYRGFEFEVRFFEDENHMSVIPVTISRGLRYIYGKE